MNDTTLKIRQAESRDAAALSELVTSTLHDCLGDVLPQDELQQCITEYQVWDIDHPCYVAESDGVLVGYAVSRRQFSGQLSPTGPVERLYVRRGGLSASDQRLVATSLLVTLCEPKAGFGLPAVTAATDATTALALYDRRGFVDPCVFRLCLSLPSGEGRMLLGTTLAA